MPEPPDPQDEAGTEPATVDVAGMPDSSEAAEPPPPVFEPVAESPERQDEEFWSPAPEATDTATDAHEAINADLVDSSPESSSEDHDTPFRGHTQELAPVPEHLEGPARVVEEEVELVRAQDDESEVSGDTANLPESWEVDADHDEDDEAEDERERRQRQPAARMVPSTENVKRRTNLSGRRVPQITRSATRDEDPVEGSDGS
ncbi:MAG: hypothetical protein R3A46_00535 [Thermomicrobiales bacterium]